MARHELIERHLPSLCLRVMNIGLREDGVDWAYHGVNSPFCRLFFVTEGKACTHHHGRTYEISAGKLHLVPCFTQADYFCSEYFKYYYIQFTARVEGDLDLFNLGEYQYLLDAPPGTAARLKRIHELIPGHEVEVCRPHTEEQKRGFLKRLDGEDFKGDPAAWLESDGLLRELIAPFLDTFTPAEPADEPDRMKFLFNHIEEHLTENLSLGKLAEAANLHPAYFSDLFHRTVGVRPIEFVHRRRIERAQLLMLAHGASVKEAAYEMGFSDPSYFSRLFKKYTGKNPSEYVAVGTARDVEAMSAQEA